MWAHCSDFIASPDGDRQYSFTTISVQAGAVVLVPVVTSTEKPWLAPA